MQLVALSSMVLYVEWVLRLAGANKLFRLEMTG